MVKRFIIFCFESIFDTIQENKVNIVCDGKKTIKIIFDIGKAYAININKNCFFFNYITSKNMKNRHLSENYISMYKLRTC